MEEKTKAPFWKPALIYGAIVGFVGILVGVIFYVMDLMTESWVQWISLLISVVVLVYCLTMYKRDYLGGYASYGQIWKMTIVIGVFATILGAIYGYILMGVIDPELVDKLKLAQEQKILNNPRIPEGYMDTALERLDKQMEIGRMTVMQLIFGPVMYAIVGLVLAAFIKKNNPADKIA
jgi:ABC-type multidrug transport system permease subunit